MKKILTTIGLISLTGLVSCSQNDVNHNLNIDKQSQTRSEISEIQDKVSTIVGKIVEIKDGKDGSQIVIRDNSGYEYTSILSIPNLGTNSKFDFSDIKIGNTLKLKGDMFKIGEKNNLIPKYAKLLSENSMYIEGKIYKIENGKDGNQVYINDKDGLEYSTAISIHDQVIDNDNLGLEIGNNVKIYYREILEMYPNLLIGDKIEIFSK
ncbi:MAG: hypothetical protein QM490_02670 [Candidatus Gracilibacteria bacterium]